MKISVAMTTYNGAQFLRQQLESIFAQSRLPDELIVCDDLSNDGTFQILSEYSGCAALPLRIVRNESRMGSTKNFEQAIRLCGGELIVLSDQDDLWYPTKIETIERRFAEEPELGLVFTNGDLIDENGQPLAGDMWTAMRFSPRMQQILDGARAHDLILSWPFVTGATAMFRASLRDVLLPIPAGAPTFVHDRWIAVVTHAVSRISFIADRLIAYRLHSNQQIGAGPPLLARLFNPYHCSSDMLALAALHERLAGNPKAKPEFLSALEVRERHLRARSAFSLNPITRLKAVASEYLSGRYQRYPMPLPYAVRDLLVGTR